MNAEELKDYLLSEEIEELRIIKILNKVVTEGEAESLDLIIHSNIWQSIDRLTKESILCEASYIGRTNIVELLLENHVKPTQPLRIWKYYSALGLAIQERHYYIVDLLVKAGANINDVGQNTSALSLSALVGDVYLFNYFWPLTNSSLKEEATINLIQGIKDRVREEEADSSIVELSQAAFARDIQNVNKILSLGLDVNCFDDIGSTPLFSAICSSCPEIVKKLLNAGANPNIGNDENTETPLIRAVDNPYNSDDIHYIFNLLLDSGADPNIQVKDGETALMRASRFGNLYAVQKLMEYSASTDIKDHELRNALDYAIKGSEENEYPKYEIYQKLIKILQSI
jgi:ankyrin repeat protein